jgi:phage baseplate assembly protein gpV
MFERTNFDPVLEMTLVGPKVAGCTTGSGGTEITQTFTANLKNGAGGAYTLPFSGFTVKGLCGSDTSANAVANVRASLARVVINVPGTSFNFTNLVEGNYSTGLNLGPIGFTNN